MYRQFIPLFKAGQMSMFLETLVSGFEIASTVRRGQRPPVTLNRRKTFEDQQNERQSVRGTESDVALKNPFAFVLQLEEAHAN